MAIPVYLDSSSDLRLDLDAWKWSKDMSDTTGLHGIATKRLNFHLRVKAAAELERDLGIANHHAPSNELAPLSGHDQTRPKKTFAGFAQGALNMAYWDLTEYSWSLENLALDIAPAMARSYRLLVACAVAKGLQFYLWPSVESAAEGRALTALTNYHAAFYLVYVSSIRLISCCGRRVEELRGRIRDNGVSREDVRALDGLVYKAANWLARRRNFRRYLYEDGIGCNMLIDLCINLLSP